MSISAIEINSKIENCFVNFKQEFKLAGHMKHSDIHQLMENLVESVKKTVINAFNSDTETDVILNVNSNESITTEVENNINDNPLASTSNQQTSQNVHKKIKYNESDNYEILNKRIEAMEQFLQSTFNSSNGNIRQTSQRNSNFFQQRNGQQKFNVQKNNNWQSKNQSNNRTFRRNFNENQFRSSNGRNFPNRNYNQRNFQNYKTFPQTQNFIPNQHFIPSPQYPYPINTTNPHQYNTHPNNFLFQTYPMKVMGNY